MLSHADPHLGGGANAMGALLINLTVALRVVTTAPSTPVVPSTIRLPIVLAIPELTRLKAG
ncbi:hypothetical protein EAH84_05460 [Sphingomonas oligophenolica]|uniref:Uncharacterized protein n=1 Tax=Sphingomonas oligophenolica TaxID=301154 RepID=A0A502CNB1_9SPHN|nr:hypothetical protein EAH84_05460 [Sphingomonas oligophenolica]